MTKSTSSTSDKDTTGEKRGVQRSALHNGLDVLLLLSHRSDLTLTEISQSLNRSKSGMHAILNTLCERGFIERLRSGAYQLGARAWELGRASSSYEIRELAQPHLEKLESRTGESTILGRLDGFDVVYLSTLPGKHPVRVNVASGDRQPANLTSTGIALLAALEDKQIPPLLPENFKVNNDRSIATVEDLLNEILAARKLGYAVMKGGWHQDVGGVAKCIRAPHGGTAGAICISAPLYRVDASWLSTVCSEIDFAARSIEDALQEAAGQG